MTNKEAIVWLKECKEHYGEYHEMCDEALDIAIKALEERPQGKWKNAYADGFLCSECFMHNNNYTNFCPNCGCRMIKEGEE